jgi:hypothetical protein
VCVVCWVELHGAYQELCNTTVTFHVSFHLTVSCIVEGYCWPNACDEKKVQMLQHRYWSQLWITVAVISWPQVCTHQQILCTAAYTLSLHPPSHIQSVLTFFWHTFPTLLQLVAMLLIPRDGKKAFPNTICQRRVLCTNRQPQQHLSNSTTFTAPYLRSMPTFTTPQPHDKSLITMTPHSGFTGNTQVITQFARVTADVVVRTPYRRYISHHCQALPLPSSASCQ